MHRMFRALFVASLALGATVLSWVVLESGLDETRLALSGKRRDLDVTELATARGWVAAYGCVRHDLAVGVTPRLHVYRLGEPPPADSDPEQDRIFTPLAAREDCDEDKPPKRLYALVENDDSLGDTIRHVYAQRVAPPPVPAIVSGVIGYGAGHRKPAQAARLQLHLEGPPLVVKGKQPGVLWVALVTTAAGAHGFLFAGLGVWWLIRRERRRRALLSGQITEAEEDFFRTETLE
jgi:hypothetical protein